MVYASTRIKRIPKIHQLFVVVFLFGLSYLIMHELQGIERKLLKTVCHPSQKRVTEVSFPGTSLLGFIV